MKTLQRFVGQVNRDSIDKNATRENIKNVQDEFHFETPKLVVDAF